MDDRDKLSIAVYQRLSMGHSIDIIRHELGGILPPEEVDAVMEQGKERYHGYTRYLVATNKDTAKTFLLTGAALIVIPLILISLIGYPEGGRGRGVIFSALIFGVGAVIYAIHSYLTATPKNRRTDI